MSEKKLTDEKTSGDHWLVENAKKQWLGILVIVAGGIYNFVGGSHDSYRDLGYKLETVTVRVDKLEIADKQQTDTQNQFLIGLTKISEAQTRLAQDVQKIQDQQQKNTEVLLNRK